MPLFDLPASRSWRQVKGLAFINFDHKYDYFFFWRGELFLEVLLVCTGYLANYKALLHKLEWKTIAELVRKKITFGTGEKKETKLEVLAKLWAEASTASASTILTLVSDIRFFSSLLPWELNLYTENRRKMIGESVDIIPVYNQC